LAAPGLDPHPAHAHRGDAQLGAVDVLDRDLGLVDGNRLAAVGGDVEGEGEPARVGSLLQQGLPGCELLASPDFLAVLPLANGSAVSDLPIPVSAPLIGAVLHHQVVALELGGGFVIAAATSTNGLRFRLGVF